MYKSIFILLLGLSLLGCTYSVVMNHTEGQASDMVDENQTPTADIKPNISVPLK